MRRVIFTVIILAVEALLCNFGNFDLENAEADSEVKTISDDATGGSCTEIGAWNVATKTCTLGADGDYRVLVQSNGITLDGNGHTLAGNATEIANDAITVAGKTGVTIKNITLTDFSYGVHLLYADGNSVSNINATGNLGAGISLSNSNYNTLTDDVIVNFFSDTGICIGYASTHNILSHNHLANADRGIYVHDYSSYNTFSDNTLTANLNAITLADYDSNCIISNNIIATNTAAVWLYNGSNNNVISGNTISNNASGLYISNGAINNQTYHNNFLGNRNFQAAVVGGGINSFNQPAPIGGNYWGSYDTPAEGCNDVNSDGFCDAPYVFNGGQDNLPVTSQNEWACTEPTLSLSVPNAAYWASFADFQNSELSIDWKITNTGSSIAENVMMVANYNTNGVSVASSMPISMGSLATNGGNATTTVKTLVPSGVYSFHSRIFIEVQDLCGTTYFVPGHPPEV